jgi:hypothetical protein
MRPSYEHQCCECGKIFVIQVKPNKRKPRACAICKRRRKYHEKRSKFRDCRHCGATRKLEEFSQRRYVCNVCVDSERQSIEDAKLLMGERKAQGLKFCSRCKEWKFAESSFHKSSGTHDGFVTYCKSCVREWQRQNKERMSENAKRWQRQNPERQAASAKRWYKKNAVYNKAKLQARAARKRQLPSDFTEEDWGYAIEYFNGCCAACGRQLNDLFGDFYPAADHWIPLSCKDINNPGTVPSNIVPLCHGKGGCNNSKKDKLPTEWLEYKFGKRKAAEILKRIEAFFATVRKIQ